MHNFFSALGRFTVKYRWIVLVVWLLGTGLAVKTLPSLASQVTNDNTKFLPSNAPDVQAANLAAPLVGKEILSPIIVVAARPGGTIGPAVLSTLEQVGRDALRIPNVHKILPAEPAPGHHAALVEVLANVSGFSTDKAMAAVNAMQRLIDSVRAPPGVHLALAGQVVDEVAQNAASKTTGNQTQGLSVIFILILLFVIFRSALAPFVTLLPPVVVLALAGSFIGELGAHGLKISEVTQLLLIVLLLGAGTDYGLFLVFRVREGVRDGLDPKQAVSLAVSRVGESISASAGTVIFALLSLLLATFGIYHDLGVPLAIGIATMLIAGLTLLPALLAILGRAVFWPSIPKAGDRQGGWWGRIAARIVGRPVPTLVIGLLIFGALAGGAFFYSPSGFGGATKAPTGTAAARGDSLLAKYFPQSSANPTNLIFVYRQSVWQDPGVLLADEASIKASGYFKTLLGPLDPSSIPLTTTEFTRLHSVLGNPQALPAIPRAGVHVPLLAYVAYKAESQFVSPSGHVVQFQAGLAVGDPGKAAALDEVPRLRDVIATTARATGAVDNGVAGEAAALYDISSTSDSDLIHIIPIAVIAIALLLGLVLRSAVAPLYLIASVVLSYLAALGLASLVFIKIGGEQGLTFLLPFLMFIFLLALGEDYNILVMTRIREEAHDHTLKDAVVRAVGMSGPTITSAGLVLAGSFAVLAVAGSRGPGGSQVRDIGFGLAVGILMDTFLVRTLLVPSTVAILGRWNWWPRHVEAGMGYPGGGRPESADPGPASSGPASPGLESSGLESIG
jgi:RND superfamily putative drug exporter